MRFRKSAIQVWVIFSLLQMVFVWPLQAQEKEPTKKEKKELQRQSIRQMVDAKNYKIQVSQASGSKGRQVNLTGSYGMSVSNERVQVDLPFYGESYGGGTAYGGEGGVKMDSKDFTYESKAAKKGGWDITITPKDDNKDVRAIMIGISSDGYVSINVNLNNRTPMRYSGVLVKDEKK